MGKINIDKVSKELMREYEKHTETQKEIIDIFKKIVLELAMYEARIYKMGWWKRRKKLKRENLMKKQLEIQQKHGITEQDALAATFLEFTLSGKTYGIMDYVKVDMVVERLKEMRDLGYGDRKEFRIGRYQGVLKELFSQYI